jgi:hypothetical protein
MERKPGSPDRLETSKPQDLPFLSIRRRRLREIPKPPLRSRDLWGGWQRRLTSLVVLRPLEPPSPLSFFPSRAKRGLRGTPQVSSTFPPVPRPGARCHPLSLPSAEQHTNSYPLIPVDRRCLCPGNNAVPNAITTESAPTRDSLPRPIMGQDQSRPTSCSGRCPPTSPAKARTCSQTRFTRP